MKKYILGLLLVYGGIQAQEASFPNFRSPFDFPLYMSGNFGELRSNHFHGGVDFKTEGAEGKTVYCIADGYVSRIVVSSGGYGNALYICHDNGYTSVHGHLKSFVEPIASFVKSYQYKNETFAVDLMPDSTRFVFKRGQPVAFSGNTGYSFGPHLHMEIRDTKTNELIDPLQFYMKQVKDTKPPVAKAIMFYPKAGKGMVNGKNSKHSLTVNSSGNQHCFSQPVYAWGEIGLGIKAYDYMDGTSNNYGVRSIKLYVDSIEIFNSTVDRCLLEENRMINSWTDFAEYKSRNSWFMKSYIESGNPLRMLKANSNNGMIYINEEKNYHIKYVLSDLYGNTSQYNFVIKGRRQEIPVYVAKGKHFLQWNKTNIIQEPGMHLIIPRGMLYEDVDLNSSIQYDSSAISFEYVLHDVPVPLHRGCDLIIGIRNMPVDDTSKYYIARRNGSKSHYVGGTYEDGWLRASILELGTYKIETDTVPPKIEALNKASWKRSGTISFKISDGQSGIKSYKGKINGKFALFAFDAKSGRYFCKPEPELLVKGNKQQLEITVEDRCGNIKTLADTFIW